MSGIIILCWPLAGAGEKGGGEVVEVDVVVEVVEVVLFVEVVEVVVEVHSSGGT